MANKVGIGIEAQLDTSAVEQRINAFGQRVAQANKAQFSPISARSIEDITLAQKKFEQLLRVHGELNRRVKATGQSGKSAWDMDFGSMFPGQQAQAQQMRRAMEYMFGDRFSAAPNRPGPAPSAGGGNRPPPVQPTNKPPPAHQPPPIWQSVAQAGLRAAGPAGGVAAGSLGTGMASGFGAGMMGLMGGMLALGVGKLVGSAMEKIGHAEDNNVALDRLKRTLGDVNVSFTALKESVHLGAEGLKITYAEAGQLATQFAKLGNVNSSQAYTLRDELGVGVGLSRSLGLDPSQGVGFMGQMRGVGMTSNTQDSRRMALLIGETIAKSDAFAKADEVMEAIAGFATMQTRASMGRANVAGYAGMFAGLAGSGIPGLDPAGSGALLSRVNASLMAGGAKGEASQFFTALVGNRMGLDPIQTQIMREGGAFATNDESFGPGSAAARFGISGPRGGQTFLQGSLDMLRKQYGSNRGLMAQATSNHLGINMRQAMALLSVNPQQMGELQQYADLGTMSGNGIGNLAKVRFGSAADRKAMAAEYLGRTGNDALTAADRNAINGAGGDDNKLRDVLTAISARYDQERTLGSDVRDGKASLDNIKTNIADKMVPYLNEMRQGIMWMAGVKEGKSPKDIMEAVMRAEEKDRVRAIDGKREADMKENNLALGETRTKIRETMLRNQDKVLSGKMTREDHLREMVPLQEREKDLIERDGKIREDHTKALEASKKAIDENVRKMRDGEVDATGGGGTPGITPASYGGGAQGGRGFVNPPGVSSGAAAAPGEYDHLFNQYGKKYGVDPALLKAIAMKESSMKPGAVGGPNANGTRDYGLMQHNSRYLEERGLTEDWKNPERSIEEAAKLLASNIRRGGGNVRTGVRMYNGSGPRAEAYADDVMGRWGNTRINPNAVGSTPMPAQAAGSQGNPAPGFRVSADDITVRVVDANGMPRQAAQTISTRVHQAVPFGTAISN